MPDLFVDTSGWANVIDRGQPYHREALALQRSRRRLITSNYVLVELASLLNSPLRIPRMNIIAAINSIASSRWVEIVHVDPVLHEQGWRLFSSRIDKDWSLADCCSFEIMTQRGIGEAVTNVHHFEQAGFVRLLK